MPAEPVLERSPSPLPSVKSGYRGFTVLSTAHTPGSDVFSAPLAAAAKAKMGVWIAGREETDDVDTVSGYERFGPGYYENAEAAARAGAPPGANIVCEADATSEGGR